MTAKQAVMQAIGQVVIEPTKAAVMTVIDAENTVNTARIVYVMPRMGSPTLKQPTFNWKAADKYLEL